MDCKPFVPKSKLVQEQQAPQRQPTPPSFSSQAVIVSSASNNSSAGGLVGQYYEAPRSTISALSMPSLDLNGTHSAVILRYFGTDFGVLRTAQHGNALFSAESVFFCPEDKILCKTPNCPKYVRYDFADHRVPLSKLLPEGTQVSFKARSINSSEFNYQATLVWPQLSKKPAQAGPQDTNTLDSFFARFIAGDYGSIEQLIRNNPAPPPPPPVKRPEPKPISKPATNPVNPPAPTKVAAAETVDMADLDLFLYRVEELIAFFKENFPQPCTLSSKQLRKMATDVLTVISKATSDMQRDMLPMLTVRKLMNEFKLKFDDSAEESVFFATYKAFVAELLARDSRPSPALDDSSIVQVGNEDMDNGQTQTNNAVNAPAVTNLLERMKIGNDARKSPLSNEVSRSSSGVNIPAASNSGYDSDTSSQVSSINADTESLDYDPSEMKNAKINFRTENNFLLPPPGDYGINKIRLTAEDANKYNSLGAWIESAYGPKSMVQSVVNIYPKDLFKAVVLTWRRSGKSPYQLKEEWKRVFTEPRTLVKNWLTEIERAWGTDVNVNEVALDFILTLTLKFCWSALASFSKRMGESDESRNNFLKSLLSTSTHCGANLYGVRGVIIYYFNDWIGLVQTPHGRVLFFRNLCYNFHRKNGWDRAKQKLPIGTAVKVHARLRGVGKKKLINYRHATKVWALTSDLVQEPLTGVNIAGGNRFWNDLLSVYDSLATASPSLRCSRKQIEEPFAQKSSYVFYTSKYANQNLANAKVLPDWQPIQVRNKLFNSYKPFADSIEHMVSDETVQEKIRNSMVILVNRGVSMYELRQTFVAATLSSLPEAFEESLEAIFLGPNLVVTQKKDVGREVCNPADFFVHYFRERDPVVDGQFQENIKAFEAKAVGSNGHMELVYDIVSKLREPLNAALAKDAMGQGRRSADFALEDDDSDPPSENSARVNGLSAAPSKEASLRSSPAPAELRESSDPGSPIRPGLPPFSGSSTGAIRKTTKPPFPEQVNGLDGAKLELDFLQRDLVQTNGHANGVDPLFMEALTQRLNAFDARLVAMEQREELNNSQVVEAFHKLNTFVQGLIEENKVIRQQLEMNSGTPPPKPMNGNNKTEHVRVVSEVDSDALFEFPTDADGRLALRTLEGFFGEVIALKYRFSTSAGGASEPWRVCAISDGHFLAPDDGWGEREYVARLKPAGGSPSALLGQRSVPTTLASVGLPQQQLTQQQLLGSKLYLSPPCIIYLTFFLFSLQRTA